MLVLHARRDIEGCVSVADANNRPVMSLERARSDDACPSDVRMRGRTLGNRNSVPF